MGWLEHEDPRNAFVLKARFGVVTGEEETLEAIGRRLNITRERVRQLEKVAMTRAREIAEGLGEPGSPARPVPPLTVPAKGRVKGESTVRRSSTQPRSRAVSRAAVAPRRADLTRAPGLRAVTPRRAASPEEPSVAREDQAEPEWKAVSWAQVRARMARL